MATISGYSLYIEDIKGYANQHNLPENDTSQYVKGFLSGYMDDPVEAERHLKEFNDHIKKAVRGVYYRNQEVLESGPTPEGGLPEYDILENGYYYLRLSAAGGRGEDSDVYNKTFYKDKNDYIRFWPQNKPPPHPPVPPPTKPPGWIPGGLLEEPEEEDSIPENPTYTWERVKIIPNEYKITWRGHYTYLNNTIYLSLTEYGFEDTINVLGKVSAKNPRNKEYGIMMIRKDITDENIPNKLKLYAYRVDDSEEEAYSKYEDAHFSGGEVVPDVSSLIRRDPGYNTPGRKGGDGAYFNGLIEVREGIVGFTVGKAFPDAPNTPGGNSNVAIVGQGNIVLPGGGTANTLDFGGRGGSFVYDYYQRICYDDTRPDDGHLSLRFLGPIGSKRYALSYINNDTYEHGAKIITRVSIPNIPALPGIIITVKTLIPDRTREIDFEATTINGEPFNKFFYKMYVV